MTKISGWLLVGLLCVSGSSLAQAPHTTLFRDGLGQWHVSYQNETATKQLAFERNPDDSRSQRWTPTDSNFQITSLEGIEIIRRKDGRPFSEVSFRLTPTYTHLPKDYAPFSTFSDGGLLVHSGRFFACADPCTEKNQWPFHLLVPDGETAIVNGKVTSGSARWVDANSGMNIYIGPAQAQEDRHFVSVIDQELPSVLKDQLQKDLPELIDYFTARLPAPETKPMLFASYSDTNNGRYGRQGGVLPNQVFMHWYGRQSIDQLNGNDTVFFFAHEIAHLHQGTGMNVENPADYWVSEGSAEFMAGLALSEIQAEGAAVMAQKLAKAKHQCLAGIQEQPDFQSALTANFQLHYSCGMLIHNAINESLAKANSQTSFFDIWQAFNKKITQGSPISARTYLEVVRPVIESELYEKIEQNVLVPGSSGSQWVKGL